MARLRNDEGASAVEYSLILVAIAAVIVAIVFVLGNVVYNDYQTTCTTMHSQMAGDNCPP